MNESQFPYDKLNLQLGDIIKFNSPTDIVLHDKEHIIEYIDNSQIQLINERAEKITLKMDDFGKLNNESIINIDILNRLSSPSYAIQKGYILGEWLDLHFTGDVPFIVTGKITNLEEDMIEITSYPNKDIIYIDFGYKGLPLDLPLSKIIVREQPTDATKDQVQEKEKIQEKDQVSEDYTIDHQNDDIQDISEPVTINNEDHYKEVNEKLLELDEISNIQDELSVNQFNEHIQDKIFSADQIVFGDELEEITQLVNVPESEKRFGIEKQTQDLLDDILSGIPNANRSPEVLNEVYKMIDRFKELRNDFSVFDDKGDATMPNNENSDNKKPLSDIMQKLNQKIFWLLPVVSLKKKIYDNDEAEDEELNKSIINSTTAEFYTKINDAINIFKEGNTPDGQNKYLYLIQEVNEILSTYEQPEKINTYLHNTQVNTNITGVISDNDKENFYSSAITKSNKKKDEQGEYGTTLIESRFITQQYTKGMVGLQSLNIGGKTVNTKKLLTPNDSLTLKSFLSLPIQTVRFSHINLPSTGLYTKSTLDKHFLQYWRILNQKTFVSKKIINNLDDPTNYPNTQSSNFISEQVKEYALDTSIIPDKSVYKNFLQKIIPDTIYLFKSIKPYIKGSLSVKNVISYLEPFMVYHENITVNQYNEITNFINTQINELKKQFLKNSKAYNYATLSYKNQNTVYDLNSYLNNLFILNDNLKLDVIQSYGLTQDKINNITIGEFIHIIKKIDNGVFFNIAVSILSAHPNLMTKKKYNETVFERVNAFINSDDNQEAQDVNQDQAMDRNTIDCKEIKTIAKRYIELDELEDDNNVADLFFDKKYDPTYYMLLDEYKNKLAESETEEERENILFSILIKKNGLNETIARREAKSILLGKRKIEEGEFAILEMDDPVNSDKKILYYERKNNVWVLNNDINKDTFIDYQSKSVCNMVPTCMIDKNTSAETGVNNCENTSVIGKELKDINLQKMLDEYDLELAKDNEEMVNNLWENWDLHNKRLKSLILINENKNLKYNNQKYNLSLKTEDIIGETSPHTKSRDIILGQSDFSKKQIDILKFVLKYTTQPTKEDNPYWLYCIDTHTKLLPTFLYKLAKLFIERPNASAYVSMLEKICAEQGTISDDGDSFVDKYSGYIIRKIDFDVSAEYTDEGFKVISRDILEEDLDNSIIQEMKKQKVFESPESKLIINVLKTMTLFMGINIDSKYEFIIRNVSKHLETIVPPKKKYELLMAKSKAKIKQTYEDFFNSYLLLITLSYLLISVQINIPCIKSRKTHPGCIKSFSGYPLNGTEDKSALKYIACVAGKMEKRSIKPWDAIVRLKENDIISAIEEIINKFVLINDEVNEGIQLKLNYLALNKNEEVPEIHSIRNWTSFLPPLQNFELGIIQPISSIFKKELVDVMKKGSKKQEEMINVIRSKIIRYSLSIQELIGKTVRKKKALLTNSLDEPFLENACCHDADNNTLSYFSKEQPDILNHNTMAKQLADIYDDLIVMSKAGILVDPTDTKRKPIKISTDFSEETIYRAFIHLCKYNSDTPMQDELKVICSSKPTDLNITDSIEESIIKLKRDGKLYNKESLTQLLTIINKTNMIKGEIKKPIKNENLNKLNDVLVNIKTKNNDDISLEFVDMFISIIAELDLTDSIKMTDATETPALSKQLREFKNYLAQQNTIMSSSIIDFVKGSSKIKKQEVTKLIEYINSIAEFKITGDGKILSKEEETTYKMGNFIKNALRDITRVFPNMLIHGVSYSGVNIPSYLNLSSIHIKQLKDNLTDHYSLLYEFYKDPTIKRIMKKYLLKTINIEELIKNTILFGDSIFDDRLIMLLYQYYFYLSINNIIQIVDDDSFITQLIQQEKQDLIESSSELLETNVPIDITDLNLGDETFLEKSYIKMSDPDEIISLEIVLGGKRTISDKLTQLIIGFMKILNKNKLAINYDYKSLMEKINRSKEREKDLMTDSFKNMTNDQRVIQDIMKNHRLEKWNIGLQKGLFKYSADTYDEEYLKRIEMNKFSVGENADMTNVKDGVYEPSQTDITIQTGMEQPQSDTAELEYEETIIDYPGEDPEPDEEPFEDDSY